MPSRPGAPFTTRARQAEPLTIQVDGQAITLKSGENVDPEIYELAKGNPEFVANSEWVLIAGRWEPLAKGVTIPIEVEQIILPEGHPDFPADTPWVYPDGQELPIEVPVPLDIPAHWQGKYEVRAEGATVCYDYSVNPELKERIFCITALTETQWQATRDQLYGGEAIYAYGGVVWLYYPALENLYSGSQAR